MAQKFINCLNAALLICALFVAYKSIVLVFQPQRAGLETVGTVAVLALDDAAGSPLKAYSYYAQTILRRDIFSGAGTEQLPAGAMPADPKPSAGPAAAVSGASAAMFILRGTIAGNAIGMNVAIIRSSTDKKDGLYRIGDSIDGAEIIDIQRKKVMLRRNGREEELQVCDETALQQLM